MHGDEVQAPVGAFMARAQTPSPRRRPGASSLEWPPSRSRAYHMTCPRVAVASRPRPDRRPHPHLTCSDGRCSNCLCMPMPRSETELAMHRHRHRQSQRARRHRALRRSRLPTGAGEQVAAHCWLLNSTDADAAVAFTSIDAGSPTKPRMALALASPSPRSAPACPRFRGEARAAHVRRASRPGSALRPPAH